MAAMTTTVNTIHSKLTENPLPTKWIEPKKPPFRKSILEDKNVKQAILTHKKQGYLNRYEKEKLKNTFKKQLCIEMLKDGYHKSFRELDFILKLQIEDRYRLGSEHPIWERPLLDQENNKLEYLCTKLNAAEASERIDDFKNVYKFNNDLASYFLLTDDSWLSDYFYEKCLEIVTNKAISLDPQRLAEAHANLGLAYERRTEDYTAKSDRIKESFFKAMDHFQEYYNLAKGNDYNLKNNFTDLTKDQVKKLLEIRNKNVETSLKDLDSINMFIDACIHLQRIYIVISNKYAKSPKEKIEFLTKAYDVCKSSLIGILEGQASFLLGNAYSESSDLETALSCYKNYHDISKREKDLENFGKASEALANCHEKLGQINKSIDYLEKYLQEVSNKHADKQYARACNCLANIYNTLGNYEMAAEYSKRAFDISRQMNDYQAIEFNRVLFGVAKAHKFLSNFNSNIDLSTRKTINNLIKWKYEPEQEEILKNTKTPENENE